jgi:hypothetical protein
MQSPSLRRRTSLLASGSLLALTLGCTGSAPDVSNGAPSPVGVDEVTESEALSSIEVATRLGAVIPTQAEVESVALQIPGRNLALNPPKVAETRLVPQPDGGDARLEVTFAEAMPPTLKLLLEGKVTELRDDGRGEDRVAGDGVHTAQAPKDWEQVRDEEHVLGERPATASLGGLLQEPGIGVRSGTLPHFQASLLITDLLVVNNSTRVSDPCVDLVTPSIATKRWTFGYLMNHMANTAMTGVSADTFARAWLSSWITPTTINGDPVRPPVLEPENYGWDHPDNIPVPKYVLETWKLASRVRSDGTLDSNTNPPLKMEKAPFRLLAIAFRPDLRTNGFFGEGTAGELRFVFGVLDLDPNHAVPGWGLATNPNLREQPWLSGWGEPCRHLDGPKFSGDFANSTVILEYAVDKATQTDVINWAKAVSNLSNLGWPPTSTYRSSLQDLTESVVRSGLGKSRQRANESGLIRIRTNEAVSGGGPWHLREFGVTALRDQAGRLRYQSGKLLCKSGTTQYCVPRPQTVKQTPAVYFAGSKALSEYTFQNEQAILAETHIVPTTFNASHGQVQLLGGQAVNQGASQTFWSGPAMDFEVRHKLSLNTCNGCHSAETGTHFAHVMSRESNTEAPLSAFLSGFTEVADPITGDIRWFNEPDRRALDLKWLSDSTPMSMMSFQPTSRTH